MSGCIHDNVYTRGHGRRSSDDVEGRDKKHLRVVVVSFSRHFMTVNLQCDYSSGKHVYFPVQYVSVGDSPRVHSLSIVGVYTLLLEVLLSFSNILVCLYFFLDLLCFVTCLFRFQY